MHIFLDLVYFVVNHLLITINQGRISPDDIMRIAKELGESFTPQEIKEMIDAADRNREAFFLILYEMLN